MLTAEATVPTERPSRYLTQLCRHASQMSRHRITRLPAHVTKDPQARHEMPREVNAEWSETEGTVRVDGATCTLQAGTDVLRLRVEATDEPTLLRIQDMITRNLSRFSRREPLTVTWQRVDAPADPPPHGGGPLPAPTGTTTTHPRRRRTIMLIVLGGLAVAAHVVLGAAALAAPPWAGWAADTILAVVLLKAAVIGLGYLAHRRRKTAKTR